VNTLHKWGTWWRSSWGTALQSRRSGLRFPIVSLEFFIDIIFPAALCNLASTQPLTEMSTRSMSWGVKAAGAKGWQPYHHLADWHEILYHTWKDSFCFIRCIFG